MIRDCFFSHCDVPAMPQILISQYFDAPIEQVFARFDTHAKLNQLFAPLQVERVQTATEGSHPDGVGSVRHMGEGPFKPVAEQITAFELNQRIEYKLINNPLIRHHRGEMRFTPKDAGTLVSYTIELEGRIPFSASVMLAVLKKALTDGLARMARRA